MAPAAAAASAPPPPRAADAAAAAAAAPLASLLTVVLNTSPCYSHPSTRLLEETVASFALAPGLPACRLLVVADGCKLAAATRVKKGAVTAAVAEGYRRYLARVAHLTRQPASVLRGAELLALDEHHGCAHALRRGLARVRTPFVIVVQHDRPLCSPVELLPLVRALQAAPGDVNYVGLVTTCTLVHAHRQVSRGLPSALFVPREVAGVRLLPLAAFLDSTHLAPVAWYRSRVFGTARSVPLPRGCYLEDTLGQAQLAALRAGGPATHAAYGTFLAHAGDAQRAVVTHLDGHDGRCGAPDWRKWLFAAQHTSDDAWAALEAAGALDYAAPPGYETVLGYRDESSAPAEQAYADEAAEAATADGAAPEEACGAAGGC